MSINKSHKLLFQPSSIKCAIQYPFRKEIWKMKILDHLNVPRPPFNAFLCYENITIASLIIHGQVMKKLSCQLSLDMMVKKELFVFITDCLFVNSSAVKAARRLYNKLVLNLNGIKFENQHCSFCYNHNGLRVCTEKLTPITSYSDN